MIDGDAAASSDFSRISPRLSGRNWYTITVKPENLCKPAAGLSELNGEIEIFTSGVASSGRVRANSAQGPAAIVSGPSRNIM